MIIYYSGTFYFGEQMYLFSDVVVWTSTKAPPVVTGTDDFLLLGVSNG